LSYKLLALDYDSLGYDSLDYDSLDYYSLDYYSPLSTSGTPRGREVLVVRTSLRGVRARNLVVCFTV